MTSHGYFGFLAVGSTSAFLRGQTDRLLLASLASAAWAGYYSIAARLASLIMELSNLFYVPTMAAAGALWGAGKWAEVRLLFRASMTVVSLTGGLLGVALIGCADTLILLWLGRPVPQAALILRILASGTLVAVVLTGPGTALCKGIGRPGLETRYVVVGLLANVVLTISLTLAIGPMGSVIASSASWALSATYFAHMLQAEIKIPRSSVRRSWATLAAAGLAAMVAWLASTFLPYPTGRVDALITLSAIGPLGLFTYWAGTLLLRGNDPAAVLGLISTRWQSHGGQRTRASAVDG